MGEGKAREGALAQAWAASADGRELWTQEGERLRVLFPGRAAGGPGPDFRGALLATERGRVRGDVELHLAASGWRDHGHGRDRRYNGVVLHVVGRDDTGGPTRLASGARVPVVVFPGDEGRRTKEGATPRAGLFGGGALQAGCCLAAGGDRLAAALGEQGLLRFRVRAARWRRAGAEGPDEALYRGLLEGMGLGGARRPFRRLAAVLPWERVRREGPAPERAVAALQAVLLGTAGLLHEGPVGVRAQWQGRARVRAASWRGWACRPGSAPARRLLGLGALLARGLPLGPAGSLLGALSPLPQPRLAPAVLRGWLTVTAEQGGLEPGPAPLGAGRADILAVNVLLPFLAGQADPGWAEAAFGAYPSLEADGVVRGMVVRLGLAGAISSACQQQGLHRVFRHYCARGRGERCPLRGTGEGGRRRREEGGRTEEEGRTVGGPAADS